MSRPTELKQYNNNSNHLFINCIIAGFMLDFMNNLML